MNRAKREKWLAIAWIDLQFAKHRSFPTNCSSDLESADVSLAHIKAWREWRLVPAKRKDIDAWVATYLTGDEKEQLAAYIASSDEP